MLDLRRRQFITLLGGAAAAWPLAARAQQRERMRRIGVLLPATADDAHYQTWFGAFLQGLEPLGWTIGRDVQIDTRWATANADAVRRHAADLVALAPDVILAPGASTVGPLLQATHGVPIVFAVVADPVGAGFVENLARPGGNATGFMAFEIQHQREMAGTAQAGCADGNAGGSASRFDNDNRNRPIRRHPGTGTIAQGGDNPDQRARPGGNGARNSRLRARCKRRSDRYREWACAHPSRPHSRSGGTTQATRDLFRASFRR